VPGFVVGQEVTAAEMNTLAVLSEVGGGVPASGASIKGGRPTAGSGYPNPGGLVIGYGTAFATQTDLVVCTSVTPGYTCHPVWSASGLTVTIIVASTGAQLTNNSAYDFSWIAIGH
jgi:hypothetical protein